MEWDSKEVREFKAAFNQRKQNASLEDVIDAGSAYAKALAMLRHRRDQAMTTLEAIEKEHDGENRQILKNLRDESDRMTLTNESLEKARPVAEKDKDTVAEALIDAADKWIAFEAHCISARNELTVAGPEAGPGKLAANLKQRATRLKELAEHLRQQADERYIFPSSDFKNLTGDLGRCGKEMTLVIADLDKPESIDLAQTARHIEETTAELKRLSDELAKAFDPPEAIQRDVLKKTYGVEVADGKKLPYKKLLDAFAMVPPDHIVNSSLKDIVFSQPEEGAPAGSYSKSDKRITLDPALAAMDTRAYRNPETELEEEISAFSMTTLHEIGHAVDHAYGIMDKNRGEKGCGGWTEVNPIIYLQGDFTKVETEVKNKMMGDPVFQPADAKHLEVPFVNFMAGKLEKNQFLTEALKEYGKATMDRLETVLKSVREAVEALKDRAKEYFQTDGDSAFAGTVVGHVATLTSSDPPVFAELELSRAVIEAYEKDEDPRKREAHFDDWLDDQYNAFRKNRQMRNMTSDDKFLNAATDAVKSVNAAPDLLKDYLEDADPWNKDLSNAKIGDQPASHRAYKSDTAWWRYDGAARAATKVRDYQWRAPGEWFADTYSISWCKKVEPPDMVPKAVKAYCYGGHVAKPG